MDMTEKLPPSADCSSHVCHASRARFIDNFLRRIIHNPVKMFRPFVRKGGTALDVGCGRGFASLGLAELVGEEGRVYSADLQSEMLAMVEERAQKAGVRKRVTLHLCEKDRIGLDAEIDFALAFYMVHEVPDAEMFFREILSLLTPGGVFYAIEPKFHVSNRAFQKMIILAESLGFKMIATPWVWFSRAVVLKRT